MADRSFAVAYIFWVLAAEAVLAEVRDGVLGALVGVRRV